MQTLSAARLNELRLKANDVRQGIIRSLVAAGSGHSAGPLDMADIFAALYGHLLRHDPANPEWPERDRLLLSCGHIAPVRYSAMANFGYFPVEELLTLRKFGSRLQGHPERVRLPAVETTSGPLGEGLANFKLLQRRQVPSRFVVFPDEGHMIGHGENARDRARTIHFGG